MSIRQVSLQRILVWPAAAAASLLLLVLLCIGNLMKKLLFIIN